MHFRENNKEGFSATSLQPQNKFPAQKRMAPTLLRKVFDKSPQRKDSAKLLPQLRSARSSGTLVNEGSGTEKHPNAEEKNRNKRDIKTSCVQICPHQVLSFERMKRIVHLPYFKYSGDQIDAFTNVPGPYHLSLVGGTHLCKPHPKSFSSLKADSFYKYQQGYEGSYDGLLLYVHWTVIFDNQMGIVGSVSDLQRFLDTLDIYLCQHTKMSDLRIATKLHGFCNPSRQARDPVEAYEEEHRGRQIEGCKRCHTTFETYKEGKACRILVKRYLGKGWSPYEKRWLAQCGEEKHRLRSLGTAVLQSLAN